MKTAGGVVGILGALALVSGCDTAGTSTSSGAGATGGTGAGGAGSGGDATCSDGTADGSETDVDCGGATECARCADGKACAAGSDCEGEVCTTTSVCCTPEPVETTCAASQCGGMVPNNCGEMVVCGDPVGPCFVWSKQLGGPGIETLDQIVSDAAGNVFVTGRYVGVLDLGGGTLPLTSGTALFLVKLDPAGNHLWSKAFELNYVDDLAVDPSGNVLLTVGIDQPLDFGGGLVSPESDGNMVVVKFDGDGNHLWDRAIHGSVAARVDVDPSGNVFLAGGFGGELSFGPFTLTSVGSSDIFIAKLGPDGAPLWGKRFGEGTGQWYFGAFPAADALGNVFLAGSFDGAVDFGSGVLTDGGSNDLFATKLDAEGNVLWSRQYGSTVNARPDAVAVDHDDNLILAGQVQAPISFGGDTLPAGIVVAKISPEGDHLWSRSFSATSASAASLAVMPSNAVVMAGNLNSAATFDVVLNQNNQNDWDVFLVELGAVDGAPAWSRGYPKTEYPILAVDGDQLFMGGEFHGKIDFGLGQLTPAGGFDIFLTKLTP